MSDTIDTANGGWQAWSKHVLMELERLNKQSDAILSVVNEIKQDYTTQADHDKLKDDYNSLRIEFATFEATQKVRNAMISMFTSAGVTTIVGLIIAWLSK